MYLNTIKGILTNPKLVSFSTAKNQKLFLKDQEQDNKTYSISVLEVLVRAMRQNKKIKSKPIRGERVILSVFANSMIWYTENPKYSKKFF